MTLPNSKANAWRSAPASPRSLSPIPGRGPAATGRLDAIPSTTSRGSSSRSRSSAPAPRASSIKVVVRMRPLNDVEKSNGEREVAEVSGSKEVRVLQAMAASSAACTERCFDFHACLGPAVGQADVFNICGISQLVDAALRGYNGGIFCFLFWGIISHP